MIWYVYSTGCLTGYLAGCGATPVLLINRRNTQRNKIVAFEDKNTSKLLRIENLIHKSNLLYTVKSTQLLESVRKVGVSNHCRISTRPFVD